MVPWDAELRELRASAYLGVNNLVHAISDLRSTTKLRTDDTSGFYKLAQLHYELGEATESLAEVRECLKLDPEHKDCQPLYKKLKTVAKFINNAQEAQNAQKWDDCMDAAKRVLKQESEVKNIRFHAFDRLCHCNLKGGEAAEARKACTDAIDIQEEPRIYCDRAEAYLAEDMLDEVTRPKTALLHPLNYHGCLFRL
jgi:DnaJ family protein C protein 3